MKRLFLLIFFINTLHKSVSCELTIDSQWHDLESNQEKITLFGGRWVWIATITVKKHTFDPVSLDELNFVWKGKKTINHLSASLYYKEPHRPFEPIEERLVCDGCWNKPQQKLTFEFEKKEHLQAINLYCLVLTIPKELESTLKKGEFTIATTTLPFQFQKSLSTKRLSFSIHKPKSLRHTKKA